MEVRTLRNVVVQESKQRVGLFLLEPNNAPREDRVDVECLLAGDGVNPNDWVLSLDWLAANWASIASRELGLLDAGVNSTQTYQALLEGVGEAVVGLDLG